jgi:hypothetical protein
MSKRPDDEKLDVQSQKKVKMSSQNIEVSSNTQQTELKVSTIFLRFPFLFSKQMDSTLNRSIGPGFQTLF